MNEETLKFIKIRISKGSFVPGSPAKSPHPVACGEGNIHQRRVLENGERGKPEIAKMV